MTDGAAAFAAQVDVSRETLARLSTYHDLLQKWGKHINLVSRGTLDAAWARHFLDSAQLLSLAPQSARRWCDLGSGAGFPGLVIAILATESRPELKVRLVESDQRKAEFLRAVCRQTETQADVLAARIESAEPCGADVLSARALAPLADLLGMAERHLAPGGICLFPKGARHRDEVAATLETFTFDCEEYPSKTGADSVILKIGGIGRV
ncbi:16S rRNA (guanine(527)-N(7))-methyltransferase RsmG [Palleronia sp. KMU-117]|uniref:16S rRNA (guanine(527)-N(7))-methyltransferase RsmG n=1 Tax=Palleronia sp. KMU-117 TaxID=3434108 RepID=UPI003D73281D